MYILCIYKYMYDICYEYTSIHLYMYIYMVYTMNIIVYTMNIIVYRMCPWLSVMLLYMNGLSP